MRSHLERVLLVTIAAAAVVVGTGDKAEAASYVNRPITLSRSEWSLDLGLGVGHRPGPSITGLGFNLEMHAGLTSFLQLGIRTGFGIGRDGRATRADSYGRTFETETYWPGGDTVARPEIALRWALVHSAVELALEARAMLPTDGGYFGIMLGVPVALHIGSGARLDTGLYVPMLFANETQTLISIPLHLWLQANSKLYLGPLLGFRFHSPGTEVPFGFGLGYSVSYDVDFKTWILFPNIKETAKSFGAGAGLQIRF